MAMTVEERTLAEMAVGRAAVRRAHMEIQWDSIPANLKAYEIRLANLLPKQTPICVYTSYSLDRWPPQDKRDVRALTVFVAVGTDGQEVIFEEKWPEFPSEKLRAQLMLIS